MQVNCGDNDDPGYGKRRKRRSLYSRHNTTNNDSIFLGKTTNWEENLELKIRMPPDLLVHSKSNSNNQQSQRILRESECKIYLIVTLSVALTFCVLSATIVVVACFKKYQESKAISMAQTLEKEEREQMARTEVKSVSKLCEMNQCNFNSGSSNGFNNHLNSSQQQPGSMTSNNRPVTVRSVKRRDKAKIEEKRLSGKRSASSSAVDERTAAVMV